MPRMTFNLQGYMVCGTHEVAELTKQGWRVISDEEFQSVLDKKRKPAKSDTIKPIAAEQPAIPTSAAFVSRKPTKPSISNDHEEI